MKATLNKVKRRIGTVLFRLQNNGKYSYTCPICKYTGPFRDLTPETGIRLHAECPSCGAKERHRIQFVAMLRLFNAVDTKSMEILHFAPEPFFRSILKSRFANYVTADIGMKGVDYQVDLRNLPFRDESFDAVYASHVLEHIDDDEKALSEIRRVLRPNGMAILPVPIVADETVEYPNPNPYESGHVRAPGPDYFKRYLNYFSDMFLITSSSCNPKFQCFTFEDRSVWPTEKMPLRPAMAGWRHEDYVPICFVSQPNPVVSRQLLV